ncbi:EAL domain-containing protein [Paenibacillus sp. PL2-23]|uniref:putative bifunctional diguanylate cyclase/phosphodiesterase n=1 Tax=Paenibacillus sp. PL2-23 TaxID=2100729 RepID=UPI0030F4D4B5
MSPTTLTNRNLWLITLTFAACTFLAVACKWMPIPFLYGMSFSLSSLFVLLSLRLYGLWGGLMTAGAVGLAGYILMDHPPLIVTGITEALVVGLLLRRYTGKVLSSTVIFWVFLGIPFTYYIYSQNYTDVGIEGKLIVCILTLNAIFNALFAEVLYQYVPLSRWCGLSSIRREPGSISLLLRHFALGIVMLSFLINMLVNSIGSFREVSLYIQDMIHMTTTTVKKEWGATGESPTAPKTEVQLRKLQFVIDRYTTDTYSFHFVDNNHVIVASNQHGAIGQLSNPMEERVYKRTDSSLYLSHTVHEVSRHELYTWHREHFMYVEKMTDGSGSFVIAFPVHAFYPYLFGKYDTHFIYFACFAIVAILVSAIVNRAFTRGLQRLAASTRNLPLKLKQNNGFALPESSIAEFHSLIANFKHMAASLVHLFHESQRNNERLQAQSQLLQQSEEQLHQLAYYDTLTGLPNRLQFNRHFQEWIALSDAADKSIKIAVLFTDINRFKQVNDTLGHALGDQLLQMSAKRFKLLNSKSRSVFRLGGDEFVFLLRYSDNNELTACAEEIRDSFATPFVIDSMPLYMTVSIGISMYPEDGEDMNAIIRNADIAMYNAKEEGDGYYRYYKPNLLPLIAEKMQLENGLYKALQENQFYLQYQPKISSATGELCGIEALIRWNHPELGFIPPDKFIPLAEQSGMIMEIDRWVFHEACRQNKEWQNAGLKPLSVSVNISARHFYQGDLKAMITEGLEATGLAPEFVSLEITEGVFMRNIEKVIETIQYIRGLGIQISIDDFGTGYSSLNQLQRLPISDVKLDRSFIRGITIDDKRSSIVRAIIELAHSMNMRVVAEGVETVEEAQFCRNLNCDELQGYLFSRPLPATAFQELLHPESK